MPRQPRCDAPGALHHVWARGIDGRAIFLEDGDRYDLLHRLGRCLAWALMSNHLHLVLQTGSVPLSTVMKRIHTGFAMRFNRRSERRGYLFQSRFGSRLVRDDADLLPVVASALKNPLEGGLVRDPTTLERYPWSSYGPSYDSRLRLNDLAPSTS
jgi:putative transposase